MMDSVCADFNNLSLTAMSDVPTASRCGTRMITPYPGQSQSIRRSGSLFQQLQQRSIHGGRLLDQRSKSIHFLCRLEQHQLLLNRESCALARAVLARECHIDPQLCQVPKNIDALRLLGAFLRIMEKSPALKTALGEMICQASSRASLADDNAEQLCFPGPIEKLTELNEHLKLILAKLQGEHTSDPEVEQSLLKEAILSVTELRTLIPHELQHHVAAGGQGLSFPFDNNSDSSGQTLRRYRSKLAEAVTFFDRAIAYQQTHERIDRLEIHTILRPEPQFMALLQLISCLRVPETPSLDGLVDIYSLFRHEQIYGKKHFKCITSNHTTMSVLVRNLVQLSVPDNTGIIFSPLWVNYLGGCHLELRHSPQRDQFAALGHPWLENSLVGLRNRVIQCHDFVEENDAPERLITITFAPRIDLIGLHSSLTRWSVKDESCMFFSRLFQSLLHDSYMGMSSIEHFMSLILRSGLKFYLPGMVDGALILNCLACEFSAELEQCIGEDTVEPANRTRRFFLNASSPSPEDIKHIIQDLFRIMRLHQAQQRSCTIARTLNVRQLWHEMTRKSDQESSSNSPPSN